MKRKTHRKAEDVLEAEANSVCPIFAEYVSVLMVFLWDARHIRLGRSSRGRLSMEGWVGKQKLEGD